MAEKNSLRLQECRFVESETVFQVMEGNTANSTQKISDDLGISQSNLVSHLYNLDKSIPNCPTVRHVHKILQNF